MQVNHDHRRSESLGVNPLLSDLHRQPEELCELRVPADGLNELPLVHLGNRTSLLGAKTLLGAPPHLVT